MPKVTSAILEMANNGDLWQNTKANSALVACARCKTCDCKTFPDCKNPENTDEKCPTCFDTSLGIHYALKTGKTGKPVKRGNSAGEANSKGEKVLHIAYCKGCVKNGLWCATSDHTDTSNEKQSKDCFCGISEEKKKEALSKVVYVSKGVPLTEKEKETHLEKVAQSIAKKESAKAEKKKAKEEKQKAKEKKGKKEKVETESDSEEKAKPKPKKEKQPANSKEAKPKPKTEKVAVESDEEEEEKTKKKEAKPKPKTEKVAVESDEEEEEPKKKPLAIVPKKEKRKLVEESDEEKPKKKTKINQEGLQEKFTQALLLLSEISKKLH